MEIVKRMNGSSHKCCQSHYGHQAEKMSLAAAVHPDSQTTRLIGNPSICLIGIPSTYQLRERLQSSPKEAPKITGAELFLASSAVRQPLMKPQVQWGPLSKHHSKVLEQMIFEHCRSCVPRGWAETLCVLPVCLNVCQQLRTPGGLSEN